MAAVGRDDAAGGGVHRVGRSRSTEERPCALRPTQAVVRRTTDVGATGAAANNSASPAASGSTIGADRGGSLGAVDAAAVPLLAEDVSAAIVVEDCE